MAANSNPAVPQDYYRPPVSVSTDWANPAVLGLMGFGTTTMLAGIANTAYGGLWQIGSGGLPGDTVLGMAIFFGGLCQLFAGLIALRKGEIFAGTAFTGYGAFWMAYVFIVFEVFTGYPAADPYVVAGLMWFSIVWALFTFTFFVNAPKHGVGLTILFALLTIAFILLAINFGNSFTGMAWAAPAGVPAWYQNFMGLEIFITGALAVYLAFGILTNTNYGRKIVPI